MGILGVNFKSANYEGAKFENRITIFLLLYDNISLHWGVRKYIALTSMGALHNKLEKAKHVNLAEHFY